MAKFTAKKRILWIIIIVLLLNMVGMCIATKLIYDASFPRYESAVQTAPTGKEFSFQSGENTLWGCLYQGDKNALVVLAPGYRASEEDYLPIIEGLTDYGWGVFTFDPTGCCRSEGDSSVGFAQETLDLHAALDFVETQGRFGYEKVLLLGHSRGANAVCGALSRDVDAAVAINALGSDMEAIFSPVEQKIGIIAYSNYPLLWLYQKMLFGKYGAVKAAEQVAQSQTPLLVVQGSADTTATVENTSLYADRGEIDSAYVEYYLCNKAGQNGHTDLLRDADGSGNDALLKQINGFFDENIGECK